jgi:hypothetical protein
MGKETITLQKGALAEKIFEVEGKIIRHLNAGGNVTLAVADTAEAPFSDVKTDSAFAVLSSFHDHVGQSIIRATLR